MMSKNLMFYFSGTGNSLSIANGLAEKLGETSVISLFSINNDFVIASDVETVGLIYPIHINLIPRKVKEFIGRLKLQGNCYVYAIATHGGRPGNAGCYLHKVLKDNDIDLRGYFEISMINNTPKGVAPKILMDLEWEKEITNDKITRIVEQSIEQIESIAYSVQNRDISSLEALKAKEHGLGFVMMKLMWKLSEGSKPKLQFLLDEGCIKCGICEKVCAENHIKLVDGKPVWGESDCHYCYACFNFCPVQAIGVKHYTKKLSRYHHPDVKWEDIAAQKHLQSKM